MAELDIQGILAELSQEGVDFLVIGGVAVGLKRLREARGDLR